MKLRRHGIKVHCISLTEKRHHARTFYGNRNSRQDNDTGTAVLPSLNIAQTESR